MAFGPGVFDMKAGIVQAIYAVGSMDDHSHVEILLTADEEIGSQASRALLEERAQACGAALVLEPSADGGALKIGRKGTGTITHHGDSYIGIVWNCRQCGACVNNVCGRCTRSSTKREATCRGCVCSIEMHAPRSASCYLWPDWSPTYA
jgi:hypothetical protein